MENEEGRVVLPCTRGDAVCGITENDAENSAFLAAAAARSCDDSWTSALSVRSKRSFLTNPHFSLFFGQAVIADREALIRCVT